VSVTAGAINGVEYAETAVQQVQDDTRKAENVGLTKREPKMTFQKIMVDVANSRSDLASSDNRENGEDEDHEETEQAPLNNDDEPGCVMGTITKMVQQRMERFQQKQMKLDELTLPGWEDKANYFRERDKEYSKSELSIPTAVQPQTNQDAAAPAPTRFGDLLEWLDIVAGRSQMPQH